jgi:hypothetical protein
VYVLDALQKKARKGKKTPGVDMKRIEGRLKITRSHYEKTYKVSEAG